jgi:hypothetical protein
MSPPPSRNFQVLHNNKITKYDYHIVLIQLRSGNIVRVYEKEHSVLSSHYIFTEQKSSFLCEFILQYMVIQLVEGVSL